MWLLLIFIVVPVIEIGLFIKVGGLIGLWPTLALVVAMAFLGSWLLRTQGTMAFAELQKSIRDFRDPSEPVAHGALILFAGLLLLTPGFFTDIIGLTLLIRPARNLVIGHLKRRFVVASAFSNGKSSGVAGEDDVIDAEYVEIKPRGDSNIPSGWSRH